MNLLIVCPLACCCCIFTTTGVRTLWLWSGWGRTCHFCGRRSCCHWRLFQVLDLHRLKQDLTRGCCYHQAGARDPVGSSDFPQVIMGVCISHTQPNWTRQDSFATMCMRVCVCARVRACFCFPAYWWMQPSFYRSAQPSLLKFLPQMAGVP